MKSIINIPGAKILSNKQQKSIMGGSAGFCDEDSDCALTHCCNIEHNFCYQAAPPTQIAKCHRQNPNG